MKERPMIFSAESVRAILAGTKSQTRRVVKLEPWLTKSGGELSRAWPDKALGVTPCLQVPCPDGTVQRLRNPWHWPEPSYLWVREKFWIVELPGEGVGNPFLVYDDEMGKKPSPREVRYWPLSVEQIITGMRWGAHPSIHMPRWASRLTLEITNVRVERLASITEADARAEGVQANPSAIQAYGELWNSINGKKPGCDWAANPWVWCVEFKREVL